MLYTTGRIKRRTVGEKIYYHVLSGMASIFVEVSPDADYILGLINEPKGVDELLRCEGVFGVDAKELEDFLLACCDVGVLVTPGRQALDVSKGELTPVGFEAVEDYSIQNRIPTSVTLELTSRCNLRCRHCYLGDSHTASQELGFLQWKEILAQVIEAGCLWMSVTGGDPLLSPDFDRVYRYLVEQGVAVTVLTNGTNISEAVIDLFRELPPEKVEVSIYGATARTYEDVTRSPGSYRRFRQGVELLAEAGVNTELKAILLSLNAHQLKKMGAYAASVGSFFRFTGEIHSCLNGNPEPNRWRLKPKAVAECDFSDEERAQGIVSAFRNRTQPSSRELYRCGAGKSGFHLTSRGELQPCIMETAISFDLRHNLLADVWANQVPTAVAGDYSKEAHCPRCEYFSTCKICPPRARIATGREQEADLYLCALAEARDRLVVAYSEGGEKVET